MKALFPSYSHVQDTASCLLEKQKDRLTLDHWITILQRLQYQLHSLCERSFGYDVTLEMLLQLKVQQDKSVTLFPSIPEAKFGALLQTFQQAQVKAALEELADRFAANTSLEEIIQALCLEYSILDLSLPKGRRQRS